MVRAVGVIEIPLAHVKLGSKGLVFGVVQVVGYRGRTQYQRISVLVGKVCRVQHLAGLGVIQFQITLYKHIVLLPHGGIEGLLRLGIDAQQQALNVVGHLPAVLVHELAADKAFIAVGLKIIYTLLEAVGTHRQGMAELCLIVTDSSSQFSPVHRSCLHGLTHKGGILHGTHHSFNHRSVYRIFLDVFRRKGITVVKAESGVELPGFRIDVVMAAEPISYNVLFHVSVF